jgi:hypothetical protein
MTPLAALQIAGLKPYFRGPPEWPQIVTVAVYNELRYSTVIWDLAAASDPRQGLGARADPKRSRRL